MATLTHHGNMDQEWLASACKGQSTPDLSLPLRGNVQVVPLALCGSLVRDLGPMLLMLHRAIDSAACMRSAANAKLLMKGLAPGYTTVILVHYKRLYVGHENKGSPDGEDAACEGSYLRQDLRCMLPLLMKATSST